MLSMLTTFRKRNGHFLYVAFYTPGARLYGLLAALISSVRALSQNQNATGPSA